MEKLRSLTGLVVCVCLIWAAPARANVVTDWNEVILLYVAIGGPGTPPANPPVGRAGPPGLMDIALVHLAIHDAVQAIEGRFQPYYYSTPGVGSVDAAVAAAAYGVLVRLYPGQAGPLKTVYGNYLTAHAINPLDPGIAVGEAAAVALHTNHYRPNNIPFDPFFGNSNIGQWRSPVAMAFQILTVSEPFALNSRSQFMPPPPPPMQSVTYFREYDEVKALGDSRVHAVPPNPPSPETDKARFWAGNYVAQWNETLRQIATAPANLLDVSDSARLFALANVTAADSAMVAWEAKVFYNFWRPSTAIQNGANDPNARTAGDTTWNPFLANPPYPDYVSGANSLTGAFTGMLQEFFGTDQMDFSVKNPNPLLVDKERFFTTFSQAAQEVVDARILLGIHFRSADEEARRLGNRVAHWTFQKFLRPVPGSH